MELEISNPKFESNIFDHQMKILQKEALKKLRKNQIYNIEKNVKKLQISSYLKFSPQYPLFFSEKTLETKEKDHNKIKGFEIKINPNFFDQKQKFDKIFFNKNNFIFNQKINFPITASSDFNFELNLTTKNSHPFYYMFMGSSFWLRNDIFLKFGAFTGSFYGVNILTQKQIKDNIHIGAKFDYFKFNNIIKQENLGMWLSINEIGSLYSNIGSNHSLGFTSKNIHIKKIDSILYFNPFINYLDKKELVRNIDIGLEKKISNSGLKLNFALKISNIYQKFQIAVNMKHHNSFNSIIELDFFKNQNLVFNLGFERQSYKLVLPIFGINVLQNSFYALLTLISTLGIGYVYNKFHYFLKFKKNDNQKKKIKIDKKLKREKEIKLIQKKANENHENEAKKQGLIIIESYYGEKNIIEEISKRNNKISFFSEFPEKSKFILDVTVPTRFHIDNSCLILPKNKNNLLGFYNPSPKKELSIYIKYCLKNEITEKIYKDKEEIKISI